MMSIFRVLLLVAITACSNKPNISRPVEYGNDLETPDSLLKEIVKEPETLLENSKLPVLGKAQQDQLSKSDVLLDNLDTQDRGSKDKTTSEKAHKEEKKKSPMKLNKNPSDKDIEVPDPLLKEIEHKN